MHTLNLPAGTSGDMTWGEFTKNTTVTDTPTPIVQVGAWSTVPHQDQDLVECRAAVSYGDRIVSLSATASGPVAAMTSILHEIGAPVQIIRLHQFNQAGRITARLLCENRYHQYWAFGDGDSCDEANVNALVAGANELLAGCPR